MEKESNVKCDATMVWKNMRHLRYIRVSIAIVLNSQRCKD